MPVEFAEASEFVFDVQTGRYRYKATGAEATREAVLDLTRQAIAVNQGAMTNLAEQLAAGEIDLRQFQVQSARLLRLIHTQQAALGRGGFERMTAEDWREVANGLRVQFYAGRDATGRPFGLRWLADAVRLGLLSLVQLRQSLGQYAASGRQIFWKMQRRSQAATSRVYAVRVLGDSEHCPDCLQYAAMPPQPLDSIVLPAHGCRCGNNCKCSLLYLSLEEAIGRGLQL